MSQFFSVTMTNMVSIIVTLIFCAEMTLGVY